MAPKGRTPPATAGNRRAPADHVVAQTKFSWQGRSFELGVSVGLVPIAGGEHSVEEIVSAADACCYEAKGAGRSRVHVRAAQG